MSTPYGPVLIEHFRHPHNQGALAAPTISQEGTNPLCGDRVRIELLLDGEVVRDARFTANACAICVASASMLTDLVRSAPLEEVETLVVDDIVRALDARIPQMRMNCIRLPLTVLHGALTLYRRAAAPGERP
jgi:nitrogen fixation NifU-like protein